MFVLGMVHLRLQMVHMGFEMGLEMVHVWLAMVHMGYILFNMYIWP